MQLKGFDKLKGFDIIKAVVAASLVAALAAAPASAATGLTAHWAFDDGSGASASDSAGGNTGALTGGTQWVTGKRGGALAFDGSGSVRVASVAALEPSTITVEAWVKHLGSPGNFRYVVDKGATGCTTGSLGLYTGPDGGIMFYVAAPDGLNYTRSPDGGQGVWDGNWHLATGTFDGATVRLYVDGVQVGSGTPAPATIGYGALDTRDLFVGHYPSCAGLDFAGSIDDVRIYGRALSPTEVAAEPAYDFHGFLAPVDNAPTVNVAKAGSAVPVKFGLGGFQGLGVLAVGSPSSQRTNCASNAPLDDIEQTTTAGASQFSYNAIADQYSYVWKTESGWSGTCRQLAVALDDGTVHVANFKFK